MNTQSSKHQEYTYTAQSVHEDGATSVVPEEAGFWVQPPEGAISMERLFIDVKIRFHSSVALSNCKVTQVGIVPSANYSTNQVPANRRMIDVNLLADANRELNIKMNLSSLLIKSRVSGDITDDDHNIPIIVFPSAATGFDGLFNQPPQILWWKNDALYTTVGQV